MKSFYALTKNVINELCHDRLYLVGALAAIGLIGFSMVLGEMSFDESNKIISDFGFLGVFLIINFSTLFAGAWSIQKEMEKQTLLLMLARPISRDSFIYARFAGIGFFNLILSLILSSVVYALVKTSSIPYSHALAIGIILWAQSMASLGFVIFAAQVVRPSLAAGLAFTAILLGNWLGDLTYFANKSGEAIYIFCVQALHWLVPQYYKMNVKSWFALSEGIPSDVGAWALIHCLVWALISMKVAAFIFRRKDLV